MGKYLKCYKKYYYNIFFKTKTKTKTCYNFGRSCICIPKKSYLFISSGVQKF